MLQHQLDAGDPVVFIHLQPEGRVDAGAGGFGVVELDRVDAGVAFFQLQLEVLVFHYRSNTLMEATTSPLWLTFPSPIRVRAICAI